MTHADLPPTAARSALMSRVRSKNTKPEMVVRRVAHSLGYRFRLARSDLPGTPDLVFPRHRKIIFVHGCFWHRHEGCPRTTVPKTRAPFWQAKFDRNVARDQETSAALAALGWDVLTIWECETKNPDTIRQKILEFILA